MLVLTPFPFQLPRNVVSSKVEPENVQRKRSSPYWVKRRLCGWIVLNRQKISCEAFRHMHKCSMKLTSVTGQMSGYPYRLSLEMTVHKLSLPCSIMTCC